MNREDGLAAYATIAEATADATQPLRRLLSLLEQSFRNAARNPGCDTDNRLAYALTDFMEEVIKLQVIERRLAAIHFLLDHR